MFEIQNNTAMHTEVRGHKHLHGIFHNTKIQKILMAVIQDTKCTTCFNVTAVPWVFITLCASTYPGLDA